MAYLGHGGGPKMSEILRRHRSELLVFLKDHDCSDPQGKVQELIQLEESSERTDHVCTALIRENHGPGEFIYCIKDHMQFPYTLNAQERGQLGDSFIQECAQNSDSATGPKESYQGSDWEERTGSGEFPIFGG